MKKIESNCIVLQYVVEAELCLAAKVEKVKLSREAGNSSLLRVTLTSISVGTDPVYTCACACADA